MGRWFLVLLNKVVSLAEFVPFVTDFAAVVILVLAAVVWSALFYSVLGEKVPTAGYAFFGAVFLSSPLISEVFTYFLHNGIAIGYLCCGISLCCVREWQSSTRKMQKGSGIRQKLGCLAVAKILTAADVYKSQGWIGSILIVAATGITYALIKHYLGAEYFTPLFYTDWITTFFTDGIGAGFRNLFGTLYWKGLEFYRHCIEGGRNGLASGAFFDGYLLVLLILLVQSFLAVSYTHLDVYKRQL